MEKWKIGQIIRDLSDLKKLIKRYDLPIPSESSKKLVKQQSGNSQVLIEDFQFLIKEGIPNSIPKEVNNVIIYFDNNCEFNNQFIRQNKDIIHQYNFQINIEGYNGNDQSNKPYFNRFHLDKEDNLEGTARFTHPSYHFQFGSKSLKDKETGDLLVLTSPRIPHPPMDFFLGFHFIINNFFNSHKYKFVNSLLDDDDYIAIIKRAQERMWIPYFKAFSIFGETNNTDYTLKNVFPIYIQ